MPFVSTSSILAALKTQLEALPHSDPVKAGLGEKLFERVDFHENKKLREALQDLVIVKQRVAIIVPGGQSFQNLKEGRTVRSVRSFSFDLLIADRAWTKGGRDAVFGGDNNIGVIRMAEDVVNHFIANPQLGLAYVVLQPQEGAEIEIADDQVKDSPGRECYVLNYSTPAGEETIKPTAAWPA
jgi:hypothetical protein